MYDVNRSIDAKKIFLKLIKLNRYKNTQPHIQKKRFDIVIVVSHTENTEATTN